MSDPYLLRDEKGNPLPFFLDDDSEYILHDNMPTNTGYIIDFYGDAIHTGLKKLADAIFKPEPITEFHPDDIKDENVVRKYFRDRREKALGEFREKKGDEKE